MNEDCLDEGAYMSSKQYCPECGGYHESMTGGCPSIMQNTRLYPISKGWQCPICDRVYAPTIIMCPYCGGAETDNVTTDFTDKDYYRYREVLNKARSELGTGTDLDVLYRMGYWEAVKDRTRALQRKGPIPDPRTGM